MGMGERFMQNSLNHQRLAEIQKWLLTQQSGNRERLTRWCDTNSWSHDAAQLRTMADMLTRDFRQIAVDFTAVELPRLSVLGDDGQWIDRTTGPALLWHLRPDAKQRVLLMIHYDTVYPQDHEPTRCRLDANRLIGPGTADAKGGIATIYSAIAAINQFELVPTLGLSILLNPDEEIGSPSSQSLMRELAPQFDAALLFEPTLPDGALVRARKGSGNFSFTVHGRSAHAGRDPDAGRNAIVQAAKLTLALTQLNEPALGIQINVGKVSGGGPLNQVPDRAMIQLNVRVDSNESIPFIEESFKRLASEYGVDGFHIELAGEFHSPPKIPDDRFAELQAIVEQAAANIGQTVTWRDTGGACDGSKLAAHGLVNVDTLGPMGNGLHSPDEYCDTGTLVPAAVRVLAILSLLAAVQ